jgi:hypothetical protein
MGFHDWYALEREINVNFYRRGCQGEAQPTRDETNEFHFIEEQRVINRKVITRQACVRWYRRKAGIFRTGRRYGKNGRFRMTKLEKERESQNDFGDFYILIITL